MPHLRRSTLLLFLSLVVAVSTTTFADEPPPPAKVVSLVIDYGDGVELRFPSVPWKDDMNVGDVMTFASQHARGIKFKSRGSGATALLYRIDDLENEGGSGLNWIFRVNGELGDRSYAITPIAANDRILWKFDEYR